MTSHGIEGQQRANGSRRSQSAIYHIRFGTSSRKLTDAASQMVEKELCRCTTESFAPHGNTAARRQTIVSIRQRPKGLPAVTWSCETAPTWSSLEYPLDRKPFSWHPKFPERKRRAGASPEPRLTHHHSHCNRSSRPAARASPPQSVFDSHGERARFAFYESLGSLNRTTQPEDTKECQVWPECWRLRQPLKPARWSPTARPAGRHCAIVMNVE